MNRKISAFNLLFDYSIGTLWKIREDLWKERDLNYDQNSNRKWHPALSIKQVPVCDSLEAIPVLHGTSKGSKYTSVIVKNLMEKNTPDKETYFGRIIAPMIMPDFTDAEKSDVLIVGDLSVKRIEKNSYKPKVTDEEMKQLKKWLLRKGMCK